jgi:hypothetical protein
VNAEERSQAVFGSFDGLVSIIGFVFGLLLGHASPHLIAIGGLGGAVSATVSMSCGTYESEDGAWHRKLGNAAVMACATFVGSMVFVWSFFVFSRDIALGVGGLGALAVATFIGHEKAQGRPGYLKAYAVLFCAVGLTLAVVAAIPSSA